MQNEPIRPGDVVCLSAVFTTVRTTGSIDAGSDQLTVDSVGNWAPGETLVIDGAALGDDLITTIVSISSKVVTLTTRASRKVTGAEVGKATTPTSTTFTVEDPAGAEQSFTGVLDAVGQLHVDYLTSTTLHGTYYWKVKGTGAAAKTADSAFKVAHSRFA